MHGLDQSDADYFELSTLDIEVHEMGNHEVWIPTCIYTSHVRGYLFSNRIEGW